jgi:hypothetical protein
MIARDGLPQLLERPARGRMGSHVAMQNAATADLHRHQDKEDAETGRDCHQEIAGDHSLSMILD